MRSGVWEVHGPNEHWKDVEAPHEGFWFWMTAVKIAMTTMESENKLLARRLLEEVGNTGAVDRLGEFIAPEYVAHHAAMSGIEGLRKHFLEFRHCYPDMVISVEGQVAEGDIVVTWYVMKATHLGDFAGIRATGKRITLRGVNVQRIKNGRIVEQWGGSNSLEALLELGVLRWATDSNVANPDGQVDPG